MQTPPWSYNAKHPTTAKRPSAMGVSLTPDYYYPVMELGEIKALPVPAITDSKCVLFLWVTNPMIREGFEVMGAWGFKYVTMLTWFKTNSKGMGYWFRGYTEHMLFGIKGDVKSFRSQRHNLQEAKFTHHSTKPALFRHLIDEVTVALSPKIELFARQRVEGWDCWGDEVTSEMQLALAPEPDSVLVSICDNKVSSLCT